MLKYNQKITERKEYKMLNLFTEAPTTFRSNELLEKKQRIHFLKDILNFENETATETELQKELQSTVRGNFSHLVIVNSMLKEMPQSVKNHFEELSNLYKNELLYLRKRKKIKELFQRDSDFRLYENFVVQILVKDIIEDSSKTTPADENTLQKMYLNEKKIYQCLIYEIVTDYISPQVCFDTNNMVLNLHFLLKWQKENCNNVIEKLTSDECEAIAGLIYGLSPKKMFQLNFSSFIQSENDIDKIIDTLPIKFKAKNTAQMMFKIFNLAPHIWCLKEHIQVIKTINGLYRGV